MCYVAVACKQEERNKKKLNYFAKTKVCRSDFMTSAQYLGELKSEIYYGLI